MVGAGRVGKLHSRSINQSMGQAEVVAIVDPAESVRQYHSRMILGLICSFATLEEAIHGCDFDAVVITTPTLPIKTWR